jgi:hypothetical protein
MKTKKIMICLIIALSACFITQPLLNSSAATTTVASLATFGSMNLRSTATSSNNAIIAYGYTTLSSSQIEYIANHFNFLITNFPDYGGDASPIKNYKSSLVMIGYKDLVLMRSDYHDWSTVNSHEDWFIHDNSGHRVKSAIYTTAYLMDVSSAGWRQYWSTYVNNQLYNYPTFDGVMADDTWTQLSYVSNWGLLKDATTGATLTSADFPSNTLTNWNSNVQGMLQYVKANLPYGKIIIPNTDECFFGSHTYIDVADGALMEGYIHASFEDVTSHSYLLWGSFENSLAYLQYGTSNGKIVVSAAGATTNDAATVQFSYAGFLLGSGSTAYWGWNTGVNYEFVGTDNYQSIVATNIGSPIGACYQSQNIYVRNFTNGIVLFNPTNNPHQITLDKNYYLLNGTRVLQVLVGSWNGQILISSP